MDTLDTLTTAALMEELASRLAHSNGIEFAKTQTLVFLRDCILAELEENRDNTDGESSMSIGFAPPPDSRHWLQDETEETLQSVPAEARNAARAVLWTREVP